MTDKEKLEKLMKLADAMYYAAQNLTTDASRLHKAMDEYHKFIIYECKEEPVSEDFETALEKKVREAQDWTYIEEEGGECPLNEEFGADDLEEFARWGANWQKQQDSISAKNLEELISTLSKRYPEVSFAKLSRIVVRVARWQKEQMMKEAVDGVITFDYYKDDKAYGCVAHDSFCLEDRGLRDCDNVKIIVVKEG